MTEEIESSTQKQQASGGKRQRSSPLVLWIDNIAHVCITVGGIGTIAAVLLVFFFLLWVVWPMFAPVSSAYQVSTYQAKIEAPQRIGIDEDQSLLWTMSKNGSLQIIDAKASKLIRQSTLFEGKSPSAMRVADEHNMVLAGFDDGTLSMCHYEFKNTFFEYDSIEPAYQNMQSGTFARRLDGVVYKTPSGQWRQTTFNVDIGKALKIRKAQQIKLLDMTMSTSGPVVVTYDAGHAIAVHKIVEKKNLATMQVKKKLKSRSIPYTYVDQLGMPMDIVLIGQGEYLLLLWENGYSERYNLLSDEIFLAEKSRLSRPTSQDGRGAINCVGRFLGRNTVLLGYENGDVGAWFLIEPKDAETQDGRMWSEGHTFPGNGSPVANIASSKRQRLALINYQDQTSHLVHVTSERTIYKGTGVADVLAGCIAPKDDGIYLCGKKQIASIQLDAEHPDVSLASLFLPVWYEGYEQAEAVWQSSSASDDAEAKLGLWPLIFGTLKGTFYSLLFGVPVALAAAIYSSEFMSPRVKKVVKPSIEMMASLPSVVLGFLGGIIISVWMKDYVVQVLSAFFVIPLCVASAAYVTQLAPRQLMVKLMRWRLMIIGGPCLIIACLLSMWIGTVAEYYLFAGNFIAWLEGAGSGFGGIWYLCLPVSIIIVLVLMGRWVKPWLIERMRGSSVLRCAMVDGIKFICAIVACMSIAALLSGIIIMCGFDGRGSNNIFDIYETRNALVVGFMMAFAIIPIIYTIADDALTSVPSHLRAASLGAGATPWQTAMRVVVPTAMSGLFSAIMVGLGRAIGETMIMLMVAGNTPTQSLNIFSGFKTLSANIASELPESVMGSTHYRTLFLSALVLFLLTFVLNTAAESIRTRFRKKAVSL